MDAKDNYNKGVGQSLRGHRPKQSSVLSGLLHFVRNDSAVINIFECALFFLLIFASSTLSASEAQIFNFTCRPHGPVRTLSTTVVKESSGARYNFISEAEKRTVSALNGVLISEEAVVRSEGGGGKMRKAKRNIAADSACVPDSAVSFEDMLIFGIPALYPAKSVGVGDNWRQRFKIRYKGSEVPVTVSYRLESVEKMLGKRVAVISFLFSGLESAQAGGQRMRWAGVGREVRDVEDGTAYLRIVEVKRGRSFVKDPDISVSFAESILY